MGSSTGRLFRATTFGESHGIALGCVVENCPAGMELDETDIQPDLDRRRPGQSKVTTQRAEADKAQVLSGTFEGKTTGTPIAITVFNEDQKSKDYSKVKDIYRPSHADYTYDAKYGHRAYTGGGRASARSAIGTVAAGAIAKKLLHLKTGAQFAAYVSAIHTLKLPYHYEYSDIKELQKDTEANIIRCPDSEMAQKMEEAIINASKEKESLGGVIDLVVAGIPAGLGDPVFDRLDALLAQAMMAIPAVKGVEVGSGFEGTKLKGSEHNDIFYNNKGTISTHTNRSGGIQGGISNGEPIFMRIAFKPTATIGKEQMSVDKEGREVPLAVGGRHDPCVLPRAVPIVEAAAALVLADQLLINQTADINRF